MFLIFVDHHILMSDDKKEVEKPQRAKATIAAINTLRGKPIIVLLIIVAIALAVLLIYTAVLYASQTYKIDYYNTLWNSALDDLRNGTMSVTEYCKQAVHDQDLCDQFGNLEYRN
jgi:hypothetical protein